MTELPRMNARETVIAGMTAILPPDVPLSFAEVLWAHFEGSGSNRRAIADVQMFDGRPARLSVTHWGARECPGWIVEWLELEGGDVSWEEGRWVRVPIALPTRGETTHEG